MARHDVLWASEVIASEGGGSPAFWLGAPDYHYFVLSPGQSSTLGGWQRASYGGLDEVLGTATTGDRVTPEMLEQADIIAFEANGAHPGFSGGWESCDWEFRDSHNSLVVRWDERTVDGSFLGQPVPRDPHIIANGSIDGSNYGSLFRIPDTTITRDHPDLEAHQIVISFLLIRVRDEIDVTDPAFTVTVRSVFGGIEGAEATPDPDAIGVLLRPDLIPSEPIKPKKSATQHVNDLCTLFGVQEAILPALSAIWERRAAGQPSRNDFEAAIYQVFDRLSADHQQSLGQGFASYRTFRANGTDSCFFDDRLANIVPTRPLEPGEFTGELLREGSKVGWETLFSGSDGVIGPGWPRDWRAPDPNFDVVKGHGDGLLPPGPWPWITAIRPDSGSDNEFGNTESFIPIPPASEYVPLDYQFDQNCRLDTNPSGQVMLACERVRRPMSGPFGAGECDGGSSYSLNNDCLRIPSQQAGGSIALRGFNFIAPSISVHFQSRDEPGRPPVVQECLVFGDQETPAGAPFKPVEFGGSVALVSTGEVVIDMRVKDWVDVLIPREDPLHPGAPFPAGLYDIWVSVTDARDSNQPVTRTSNRLVLRVEPSPNVNFLLRSDRGRCIVETPGWGDDEIWWDAFVGHFVPTSIPVDGTATTRLELRGVNRQSFPREPWADMDGGSTATYTRDIFGPAPFERDGVVCVALVGFEVDSEAAARQQLQGFGNAYFEGLKEIAAVALGLEGSVTGIANLAVKAGVVTAKAVFTPVLIATAVIAGVTLVSVGFWAAWAPADLIALDVFATDAVTAFERTNPKRPLPGATSRRFAGHDIGITVTQHAGRHDGNPGALSAAYVHEKEYATDDSRYALEFRLTRTTV
jgi:hypothetical protein